MKSVAHGDAHLYLLDTHRLPTLQLWVQFFRISRCWFELWTFHEGQSHHATSGSLNFLLFHFALVVVSSAHIFRFYEVLADHRRLGELLVSFDHHANQAIWLESQLQAFCFHSYVPESEHANQAIRLESPLQATWIHSYVPESELQFVNADCLTTVKCSPTICQMDF